MNRTNILIFVIAVALTLVVGVSSFMSSGVYSSVWWSVLWVVILVGLIWSIIKRKLWNNLPVFLVHVSFVCMIIGGFCTAAFSERGTVHLSPGKSCDSFKSDDGKEVTLPAAIELVSFSQEYYQGMQVPKDFRSDVAVYQRGKSISGSDVPKSECDTMHISMNHIGKIGNYRFYQTSFDDEGGSILTVAHDPWGIGFVYIGFAIFTLAGGWMLVKRFCNSRKALILIAFLIGGGMGVRADSLTYRQVVFNGEVVPFNTVAARLTYKLTGRGDVAGLSPEEFVASLIQHKDEWIRVPFLKIKGKKLRDELHIKGNYAALTDLYDDKDRYIPGLLYEGGRGKMDNDIIALDEKLALMIDLWNGELFVPLETDAAGSGIVDSSQQGFRSDFSVKAEVAYNRLMPVRVLFIGSIFLAVLMLLSMIVKVQSPKGMHIKWWWFVALLAMFGCVCFVWHCLISAHFPLSATYEMMEFVGIMVLIPAAWVSYRNESPLLVVLALFGASFLFLVAWLGYKDPIMTPVMPVLASPWLSVHVSLVMIAYAILGFTLPSSLLALILPKQRERLTTLSISLMAPGVYLLGLGIIVGAMWANVSWGRYWAWDPKETWALVTMLLYAIPLHRTVGLRKSPVLCNLYIVLVFSAILMTYFGVNYLPSLHAYQ